MKIKTYTFVQTALALCKLSCTILMSIPGKMQDYLASVKNWQAYLSLDSAMNCDLNSWFSLWTGQIYQTSRNEKGHLSSAKISCSSLSNRCDIQTDSTLFGLAQCCGQEGIHCRTFFSLMEMDGMKSYAHCGSYASMRLKCAVLFLDKLLFSTTEYPYNVHKTDLQGKKSKHRYLKRFVYSRSENQCCQSDPYYSVM